MVNPPEHFENRAEQGSVLLVFVFLTLVLGTGVTFLMTNTQVAWAEFDGRFERDRALQEAIGDLEIARWELRNSTYSSGSNDLIQDSLAGGVLPESGVQIEEVPGVPGWYTISAAVDHPHGVSLVQQTVRETESLASYNMFVWDHPIGISGQPRGSIHTNRYLEFYFPDGLYRDSVTAVEGHEFKAGATTSNTAFLGAFDTNSEKVELEFMLDQDAFLEDFRAAVKPDFLIPEEHEADLRFFRKGSDQWVEIKEYTKPTIEKVPATKTKKKQIGGHWETKIVNEKIKEKQTIMVDKPVYKQVWVPTEGGGSIASGGAGGSAGYYKKVIDYYEQVPKEVWKTVGTKQVEKEVWVKEYEYYEVDYNKKVYQKGTLVRSEKLPLPDNGILFAEGKIKALRGEIVGRVTVGTADEMKITGNLQYVDGSGEKAFKNGTNPGLSYEPNQKYDNNAVLGLVSAGDIIYSRKVPNNFEINASMISLQGRVGIEGVVLDDNGNVDAYNQLYDEWGRKKNNWKFKRNSIRRLGGVSCAKRPVDTVVDGNGIASGFQKGIQIFDGKLLTSPPPLIPAKDEPTFADRIVLQ